MRGQAPEPSQFSFLLYTLQAKYKVQGNMPPSLGVIGSRRQ